MGSAMQAQMFPYIKNQYNANSWECTVYFLIKSLVGMIGIVLYLTSEIYITKSFNFYFIITSILSIFVELSNFFISYDMVPNLWHRLILSLIFPAAICVQ